MNSTHMVFYSGKLSHGNFIFLFACSSCTFACLEMVATQYNVCVCVRKRAFRYILDRCLCINCYFFFAIVHGLRVLRRASERKKPASCGHWIPMRGKNNKNSHNQNHWKWKQTIFMPADANHLSCALENSLMRPIIFTVCTAWFISSRTTTITTAGDDRQTLIRY